MKQIRAHTGLRGIAALLVVAYHLQFLPGHLPIEDATSFFRRSYLMVDLFFVLSGFIIAYIYDVNGSSKMNAVEVRTFFLRRLIRIYPLHLITLVAMVVWSVILTGTFLLSGREAHVDWSGHGLRLLAAQFVLVNAWLPGPNGWNIPSWSISAEFVAYLLFPLMVVSAATYPRTMRGVLATFVIIFYLTVPASGSLDITGGFGAPLRCLAGFFSGFLIHNYREHFKAATAASLSVLQLTAVSWIAFVLLTPSPDVAVMPGFILLVAVTWPDRGIVARILSGKRTEWLGEISFAVYITHVLQISVFNFIWERSGRRLIHDAVLERSLFLICCVGLLLLISSIVYVRLERPTRAYLGRRLTPRSFRGAAAGAAAGAAEAPLFRG